MPCSLAWNMSIFFSSLLSRSLMTRKGKTVVRTQQLGSSPRIRTHRHSFTYLCGSSTVFADVSIRASLMKRTLLRTPIAPHTSSSAGFCCFPVSCNGNYPSTRCIRFTGLNLQHKCRYNIIRIYISTMASNLNCTDLSGVQLPSASAPTSLEGRLTWSLTRSALNLRYPSYNKIRQYVEFCFSEKLLRIFERTRELNI